jgi:hypothetical protein
MVKSELTKALQFLSQNFINIFLVFLRIRSFYDYFWRSIGPHFYGTIEA